MQRDATSLLFVLSISMLARSMTSFLRPPFFSNHRGGDDSWHFFLSSSIPREERISTILPWNSSRSLRSPEYSSELLQRVWGRTTSVRTSLRSSPKILSRTNTTRSSRLKQATTLFLFSSLSPPRWRSLLFTNLFFYTLASLHINYLSFASSSKKLNSKGSLLIFHHQPPRFCSGANRKIRVYDSRVIVAQSFRVSDGPCALAAATPR